MYFFLLLVKIPTCIVSRVDFRAYNNKIGIKRGSKLIELHCNHAHTKTIKIERAVRSYT
jgi:hypothetical protein